MSKEELDGKRIQKELISEFEKYIEENYPNNEAKNTSKAYLSDVNMFYKYFEENFSEVIISFSRADIIEYKNHMLKEKEYKATTINRKLAALSVYENFLIEKEIKEVKAIKEQDFYRITVPYITAEMLPKRTIKKVKLLAGNTNIRDQVILVFIHEGGLRVSEVINIQLERDVNLELRKITIWGKGNRIREIIITNAMFDVLEEYLPIRNKQLAGKENKYLIISNKSVNTGKKIDRTTVNKMLEKYCKKVNEDTINPHIFRHDFATNKYEEGYTDMMLKKTLGQTSNITDRYIHPGGEKIDKILQKDKKR